MMNQHRCRCCLTEHPMISYNIFDRDNLYFDIMECVPKLKIEPNDGLPDSICDLCWLRVREAVDFKRKCEEADRELRRAYNEEANKLKRNTTGNSNFKNIAKLKESNLNDEESLLYDSTLELCELSPLEVSILNEVLLEDCNNPSSSTNFKREEDPVIIELLNIIENPIPVPLSELENNHHENEVNSINQSAVITSTTSPKSPKSPKATKSPKSPKSPKSTKTHRKDVIKKEPPICSYCGRKFTRNFQLKLHLNSAHNIGDGLQYKCEICEKTFASRNSLNYHKKSLHTEERDFACSKCDRRFVLRSQLASHERMHTGDLKPRIFECLKCGKTWPSKSDLRTHMRTHDPNVERRFQCDQCEKRFFTRGHLASHLLVHSGEKPFTCALCEKSYQSVGNLNNHLVKRHSEVVLSRSRHRNTDQRSLNET